MKILEDRIRKDGIVAPGDVLRIDSFLNHQMDITLLDQMAEEVYRLFGDKPVDKILTLEASGIAVATLVAQKFQKPLLFAKKSKTSNIPDSVYSSEVKSFTHGTVNNIIVSRDYLNAGERVLLVDDFLAMGEALCGLTDLVRQAGGSVVGAAICVEKSYQPGRARVEALGVRVESLARVASMSVETGVTFVGE